MCKCDYGESGVCMRAAGIVSPYARKSGEGGARLQIGAPTDGCVSPRDAAIACRTGGTACETIGSDRRRDARLEHAPWGDLWDGAATSEATALSR